MPTKTPEEVKKRLLDEVRTYIADGKLSKAVDHLISHFQEVGDEDRVDDLSMLSGRISTNERELINNDRTAADGRIEKKQIAKSILRIFDDPPPIKVVKQSGDSGPDNFGHRIILISAMLIILCLIIGIIVAVATQGVDPILKALQASLFVLGASMVAFGLLFFVKKYILV